MSDSRPTPPGWPLATSPWHAGEQLAQTKVGMRDRMEAVGQRAMRDYMPDQHREFFTELPMMLAGAVDDGGQPWASALFGAPGFVQSPDDRTLTVAARFGEADPLANALQPGASIGMLGLQFETRRRNRVNGLIRTADGNGFTLAVHQSFGNCPKYIQTRDRFEAFDDELPTETVSHGTALSPAARALIAQADTFFIATHAQAAPGTQTGGADVSHRGGRPGFVNITPDGGLMWPEFIGNFFFNTLGNLMLEPRAGLLFMDFERGDLLHVAGRAEVVWDGPEVEAFEGAHRLVRFQPTRFILREGASPLSWAFRDYAPQLADTGSWPAA